SMYEICVQQMRDAIVAAQTGPAPKRRGNADPAWYRQDVWPAAGDDAWIAISLRDESEWEVLRLIVGSDDIGAWTSAQDAHELAASLQRAGIAAGALQDIEDVLERDEGLRARGALVTLEHAVLGAF